MNELLVFKLATDAHEWEQIRRLNYRTFVEEIPQHAANAERALRDRFDHENSYVIALRGERLVGMICVRDRRPFSLESKLPSLDEHLPPGRSVCEIRLLSVEPDHRNTRVFRGLVEELARICLARGHDLAIISGTVRQIRLYRHIGFVPFGPLVGTPDARYQPMYLTLESFRARARAYTVPAGEERPVPRANFLPGPVEIHPEVQRVFAEPPVSHRGAGFLTEFAETCRLLCELTEAQHVTLLLGSGTLANDAVAGQLRLLGTPGLVLANGEFGERLADHAVRWGLPHRVYRTPWGGAFHRARLESWLDRHPQTGWLWAVHCETSTGVLNDLAMLREVCTARGVRLCLDCVSSLGATPVKLDGVYLASASSGKGLGAYPGVAIVLSDHDIAPAPQALPRYLDLGLYAAGDGVAFTHSSNLVRALRVAVGRTTATDSLARIRQDGGWLRQQLRQAGHRVVAPEAETAAAVITLALPPGTSSEQVGEQLEVAGFLLSYRSEYLLRRNWLQICLMGEYPRHRLPALLEALERRLLRVGTMRSVCILNPHSLGVHELADPPDTQFPPIP